ncbi:methyl-accepting chemotaxis protein [Bacillus niameyensis]|uniref:methyl-accepting chemotaxis protein n=1 Tax=Bacillus niameyensis TaxID=1522308 RepID=UPI0007847168|nr:methyl-accepting chemotaxis protein [Bacillus niameyensis]
MKVSISKKLLLSFLSILVILTAIIIISFIQISKVDRTYTDLIDDKAAKLIKIKELNLAIITEQNSIRGYLSTKNDIDIQKFLNAHDNYQQISSDLNEIFVHQEALELLHTIDKIEDDFFALGNKEIEVVQQNNMTDLTTLVIQGSELVQDFDQKIDELTLFQQKLLDDGDLETTHKVEQIKQIMLILGISAIFIGIAVALFMGRLISKPLVVMAKSAEKMAEGDLTEKELTVKSNDEIGKLAYSFNKMSQNVRHLLEQIRFNAEHVTMSAAELTASAEQSSQASEQITVTMQELAKGVDKEVQSIVETSQTINEISIGIQQIASSAQTVSSSSIDTFEKAEEGGHVIRTAIEQMTSISQTVNGLGKSIKNLGERSNEIGQITGVITEIAAQTNLLALNAAIEAARAGEHGRGFAVVAEEVGKLAALSAQSAEQITSLISAIQEETEKSVVAMEGATKEVVSGIEVVHDAGKSFSQIESSINSVTTQIQEISAAVQQLAAGSEQIVQSMQFVKEIAEEASSSTQEVSSSTEEQLASMEEITASAQSLSQMAEELQQVIGRFKV